MAFRNLVFNQVRKNFLPSLLEAPKCTSVFIPNREYAKKRYIIKYDPERHVLYSDKKPGVTVAMRFVKNVHGYNIHPTAQEAKEFTDVERAISEAILLYPKREDEVNAMMPIVFYVTDPSDALDIRLTILHKKKKSRRQRIPRARGANNQRGSDYVSYEDAFKRALFVGIPFMAFGFLDNLIMVMAGNYIEHELGRALRISTMAAAGLGNTLSDVVGISSSAYIEGLANKLGFKPPKLTEEQLNSFRCRFASWLGQTIFITLGCLLGMFPLLFNRFNKSKNSEPEMVFIVFDQSSTEETPCCHDMCPIKIPHHHLEKSEVELMEAMHSKASDLKTDPSEEITLDCGIPKAKK